MTEEAKEPEIVNTSGGIMDTTLKDLEALEIQLSDVFSIDGLTFNLTWEKVIKYINFKAKRTVLTWDHTLKEASVLLNIFLV